MSVDSDLGPGLKLADIQRQVAAMPSMDDLITLIDATLPPPPDEAFHRPQTASEEQIQDIAARLKAALETTATSAVRSPDYAIVSPKSVCSQGFSQADSGFGSPPFFMAEEDEDDGNMSGVEPLEMDDLHDAVPSVSGLGGKSRSSFNA